MRAGTTLSGWMVPAKVSTRTGWLAAWIHDLLV
jgi:hypothetical protein